MFNENFSYSDLPVLVIGAAGWDVVGRLNSDLVSNTSNPAQIRLSLGGTARNVAENLLRLGTPVTFITVVGKDETGSQIIQSIADVGANVDTVLYSSQYPTGSYLAIVDTDGKLQYGLDDMRALTELTPKYFHSHEEYFEQASMIFFDTNLSKEAIRTIMSIARRFKLPVCADPTSQLLSTKLIPYLPRIHLVAPNAVEAAVLCGWSSIPKTRHDALAAAKLIVNQGADISIITLAESGVCYATSETSGHIPSVRKEIVDPTGAGDALTAGVLFGLINQMPIDDAVRLGVAAESITLRHRGAVFPDLSLEILYDQLT